MISSDYYLSIKYKDMCGFNNINTVSNNSIFIGNTSILSNLNINNNAIFNNISFNSSIFISQNCILNNCNINNLTLLSNLQSNNISCSSDFNCNSNMIVNSNLIVNNNINLLNTSILTSLFVSDLSTLNNINVNNIYPINQNISLNSPLINIGNNNSVININGTSVYVISSNIDINKMININLSNNSPLDIGNISGINFWGINNYGYIRTNPNANRFEIKALNDYTSKYIATTDINYNFNISGKSYFQNDVSTLSNLNISNFIVNNLSILSNLYISQYAIFNTITTNLYTLSGNTTVNNNFTTNSLLISGLTNCYNNFSINSLINSNNLILSNTSLLSTLNISSTCLLTKSLTCNSDINITNAIFNTLTINSQLISDNIIISGNTNINSNLYINNTSIIKSTTVLSDLYVTTDSIINGNITINSDLNTNLNIIMQLKNYPNNLSAALDGIPLWGFYRSGGIVKLRVDIIPPTIQLIGSASILLNTIPYIDPGVIVSDNIDNVIPYIVSIYDGTTEYITQEIAITSPTTISNTIINNTSSKNYIITYGVIDSFTNVAIVTRNILQLPSNLFFWLDASASNTITLNNSNITNIVDKSGNNINMIPWYNNIQLISNGINNLSTIYLNNSGLISTNTYSNSNEYTLILVINIFQNNNDSQLIFGNYPLNGWDNALQLRILSGSTNIATNRDNNIISITYNVPLIFMITRDNTNTILSMINLTTGVITTISNASQSMTLGNYNFFIGKFTNQNTYNSNFYLGECMYWKKVLTTVEQNNTISYLFQKWSSYTQNIVPTIILNGTTSSYISVGNTYIDPGVKVSYLLDPLIIPYITSIKDLNGNELLSTQLNALNNNTLSMINTNIDTDISKYNTIMNSLYFNSSNQYLTRQFNTNNSNQWTISFWMYYTSGSSIISSQNSSGLLSINGSSLRTFLLNTLGQQWLQLLDVPIPQLNIWTHIVIKYDTTLTTANDRYICYYNNIRQANNSGWGSPSNLALNDVIYEFTNPTIFWIGNRPALNSQFNGLLSQFIFVDNQALTPDNFGYIVNNTWVAKPYIGTFGSNGWYLDFSSSSNPGLDISGNNNNWTVINLTALNIVSNNICPQIYVKNTNLITTNSYSIQYNIYNITYTLKYNNNKTLTANRTITVIDGPLLSGAYNIRNQYLYTYNPTIINSIKTLATITGWTIEFYLQLIDPFTKQFVLFGDSITNIPFAITCYNLANAVVVITDYSSTGGVVGTGHNIVLDMNKWYHIAIQRNNNNIEVIFNGILIWTQTWNFVISIHQNIDRLSIGGYSSLLIPQGNFNIAQVRINKTRRYNPPFTPSTNLYTDGLDNCIFALGNNYDDLVTNTLLNYNSVRLSSYNSQPSGNDNNSKPVFDGNAFKPTIILNGNSTVYMLINSSYNELGASVIDFLGNTTVSYTVSGTVNTSTVGSYTLKYTINNTNISINRNVNIIDTSRSYLVDIFCWIDAQNNNTFTINSNNNIINLYYNNIIFSNLYGTSKINYTAINNRPAFDFTMSAGIASQNILMSYDVTIALVVKFSSSINGYGGLWSHANVVDRDISLREQGGYIAFHTNFSGSNPNSIPTNSNFYLSNLYNKSVIIIATLSNNATQIYLQLTDLNTNTTISNSFTKTSSLIVNTAPIILGMDIYNRPSLICIGEYMHWQRVLSSTEISSITTYLYNKWK